MRVIYPYFMVWSRNGKHALVVELARMKCKRLGHKHLVGLWDETQGKHIAYCVACETTLPNARVPETFSPNRELA